MLRSSELFAQYVMPHFQRQLAATQASYDCGEIRCVSPAGE
jgi:hypothetical protein